MLVVVVFLVVGSVVVFCYVESLCVDVLRVVFGLRFGLGCFCVLWFCGLLGIGLRIVCFVIVGVCGFGCSVSVFSF